MSNVSRFRRVERCIHRHIRSGELWFVGRQAGKVVWQRLRTPDLRVARATVAMLGSNTNGNSAIFLVVDGKEQPIFEATPPEREEPLPRVRQVMLAADRPSEPVKGPPAAPPTPSGPTPSLAEFLDRWRRGKAGLKPATEAKLDDYLKMTRRYVDTGRPVNSYTAQQIRECLAKARADKDDKGQRRLKGQTINEAIWRTVSDAFDLAVEENFIARNPMSLVDRERTEPIHRVQHKWNDAERVLEDVKARAYDSYLELKFMLFMGVGQAEAKAVTGGSIDWKEKEITFIRLKTGKPYQVPIYPWAEEFIRAEIEPRLKPGKPLFDWRNPRKALATACENLGLVRVDIRSLRRTLIVHLFQQKMDIRLIADWQGHADADLILKRYGKHLDEDYKKQALASLRAAY